LRRYLAGALDPPAHINAVTLLREVVKSTLAYSKTGRP
jgi:hypothetical protein